MSYKSLLINSENMLLVELFFFVIIILMKKKNLLLLFGISFLTASAMDGCREAKDGRHVVICGISNLVPFLLRHQGKEINSSLCIRNIYSDDLLSIFKKKYTGSWKFYPHAMLDPEWGLLTFYNYKEIE